MPAAHILVSHNSADDMHNRAVMVCDDKMVLRSDRLTTQAHQRQVCAVALCLVDLLKQTAIARATGVQLQPIYKVKQQAIAWPGSNTLDRTTAVSPEPYTTDSEGTGVRYSACLSAL